jgi:hypothetical protein
MPRGRKKKIEVETGLDNLANNCWWRWKGDESNPEEIIVYTENTSLKTKIPIMAVYQMAPTKSRKGGVYAYQYKVLDGSKEHKDLFKLLELTSAHEKKEKRVRRKKGA